MADALIRTKGLSKFFPVTKQGLLETILRQKPKVVRAVDDVNLDIAECEIVAVVGESGAGKSTLGRLLCTLETPSEGEIYFKGEKVGRKNVKSVRKQVQVVFQDPTESLDPRMSIREIIQEPLTTYDISAAEKDNRLTLSLSSVGLERSEFSERRARDLSGGQRQRVAIARAMVSNPSFIVLDEPTSALDASIQAQVLNLLVDLHQKYRYTYLVITHNIAVAKFISDRIVVMYTGRMVEVGPTDQVIKNPKHPYTQALLRSVPTLEARGIEPPEGETASLLNPPSGCKYHPRCPYAMDKCKREEPQLLESSDRLVACWLYVEK